MLKIGKVMFFNTDEDFFNFAVVPHLYARKCEMDDGSAVYCTDYDFSHKYNKAVNDGKVFVIKDPDSQIFKHQAVSYRAITKPIKNLDDCIFYNC